MAGDDPPAPGAQGVGASLWALGSGPSHPAPTAAEPGANTPAAGASGGALWALGGQRTETREAAPGVGAKPEPAAPARKPQGPLPGHAALAGPLDSAARNAGGEYHAPHAPPEFASPGPPASQSVHVPDNEARGARTVKLDRSRLPPEISGRVVEGPTPPADATGASAPTQPPGRRAAVRAVAITVVLALAAASGIVWLNHRKPVAPTVLPARAPEAPAARPAASTLP